MRIAVFNTFDPLPGENGGEIRLLSIYQRLAERHDVRLVSYDLRCDQPIRRSRPRPGFEVVTAAVSEGDRYAFYMANERLGLYPHDVMFVDSYEFSVDFLGEVRKAVAWADVVVNTHPYTAKLVLPMCRQDQLTVYEAHNVELKAKTDFLSTARDQVLASRLIDDTIAAERAALLESDLVLVVSEDDAASFVRAYGVAAGKLHLVPNGVSVAAYDGISDVLRQAFRRETGLLGRDVGVFLGSAHGPNVDSYRLIRSWLARAGFDGTILVVGKIKDVYDESWTNPGFDEHWLGFVEEDVKKLLVAAADFALQIVVGGSGTNLKLFDYMAAGTPILANRFGARGVSGGDWFLPVDTPEAMAKAVRQRPWAGEAGRAAARSARDVALETFDWDSIAGRYLELLA